MQLDTNELGALADMLSAQKVGQLESELAEEKKRADYWHDRCEQLEARTRESEMKTMYLENYIMLSVERIKDYVATLNKMELWAFLRAFVDWSLPEELRMQELPLLNKAMPLPEPTPVVRIEQAGDVIAQGGVKTIMNNINKHKEGEWSDD